MDPRAVFGISALMSLVSSTVAARLYVWPWLQKMENRRALAVLVTPHMFLRFIGLSLLIPGVVSAVLPAAFARPAAYGDFAAGVLAIIASIGLARRKSWASAVVWLFNLWGTADFLFAMYEGLSNGLLPGWLGAAFFIITAVVPPLLVTHILIFRLLLQSSSEKIRA